MDLNQGESWAVMAAGIVTVLTLGGWPLIKWFHKRAERLNTFERDIEALQTELAAKDEKIVLLQTAVGALENAAVSREALNEAIDRLGDKWNATITRITSEFDQRIEAHIVDDKAKHTELFAQGREVLSKVSNIEGKLSVLRPEA